MQNNNSPKYDEKRLIFCSKALRFLKESTSTYDIFPSVYALFDLVKFITGNEVNILTRIIYVLVAIAGIVNIVILFSNIRNPMLEPNESHR